MILGTPSSPGTKRKRTKFRQLRSQPQATISTHLSYIMKMIKLLTGRVVGDESREKGETRIEIEIDKVNCSGLWRI